MPKNTPLTAEALHAALQYLKKNPGVIKFEEGGGIPPYYTEDPNAGGIQGLESSLDLSPITPLNIQAPWNIPPGQDPTTAQDDGYNEYLRSLNPQELTRADRKYLEELGISGAEDNIDSRGRLLFEPEDRRIGIRERIGEIKSGMSDRRYARRYNTEDKIEEGYREGDLSMEEADALHEGNFSGIGGRRISPERAERRENREERREGRDLAGTADLLGTLGDIVGDTMGIVRDSASAFASHKRNQQISDWVAKQKQNKNYVPISQTANTNYLGGFSYGEEGGEMGKSLRHYLNGGEATPTGPQPTPTTGEEPPELTKKQQQQQYGYQIINQLRGYYKHLDPDTQQPAEPGIIDFGGKKKIKGATERGSTPTLSSSDYETYKIAGNQFIPDAEQYVDTGISFGDNDNVVISFREHPKYGRMPVVIGTGDKSLRYLKKNFNPNYANFQEKKKIGADQIIPYYTVSDENAQGYQTYREALVQQEFGGLFNYNDGGGHTDIVEPRIPNMSSEINPQYQEGQYIEFEHGGKMHKGKIKKFENGKIYI